MKCEMCGKNLWESPIGYIHPPSTCLMDDGISINDNVRAEFEKLHPFKGEMKVEQECKSYKKSAIYWKSTAKKEIQNCKDVELERDELVQEVRTLKKINRLLNQKLENKLKNKVRKWLLKYKKK